VSAVVATYFARIFFRNAINIGLPVLEVPDLVADTGDEIEIDLKAGTVRNVTKGTSYQASPMPQVMIDILNQGGLVAYLKEHGTYDASAL
jgi:3-isopropylmalate/(R)-2-methylmalate dehydratase small subunit